MCYCTFVQGCRNFEGLRLNFLHSGDCYASVYCRNVKIKVLRHFNVFICWDNDTYCKFWGDVFPSSPQKNYTYALMNILMNIWRKNQMWRFLICKDKQKSYWVRLSAADVKVLTITGEMIHYSKRKKVIETEISASVPA